MILSWSSSDQGFTDRNVTDASGTVGENEHKLLTVYLYIWSVQKYVSEVENDEHVFNSSIA